MRFCGFFIAASAILMFISQAISDSTTATVAWFIGLLGLIGFSVMSYLWRDRASFSYAGIMFASHFFFRWMFQSLPWIADLRPVFFIPVLFVLVTVCSFGVAMFFQFLALPRVNEFFFAKEVFKYRYPHAVMVIFTILFVAFIAVPVHLAVGADIILDNFILLKVGLVFLTASLVLSVLAKFRYTEGIITGILLLVVINAFIFPLQAGVLDGGELGTIYDDILPLWRNIILLTVCILLASKFRKNFRFIAIPIFIFVAGLTVYSQHTVRSDTADTGNITSAATFSHGRNFIVIVLDGLQGTMAEAFLEEYPQFLDSFDGFTMFTRAFSSFPWTAYSRQVIQSGQKYSTTSTDRAENELMSIRNSFVSDFYNSGARVDGFNICLLGEFPAVSRLRVPTQPLQMYGYIAAAAFARLTGYWPNRFNVHGFVWETSIDSVYAHEILLDRFRVAGYEDKLLYFWDYTLHVPVVFTREGTILNEPAAADDVNAFFDEAYFGFIQLSRLFETMKANEVYDNSFIIVLSDHGHPFGNRSPVYLGDFPEAAYAYGNFIEVFRYNAMMFIKPPKAEGRALISHEPAWNGDVRALLDFYKQNFENIPPTEVMANIRSQNPQVGILFGRDHFSPPDMWNSADNHETVYISQLLELPAAFYEKSKN